MDDFAAFARRAAGLATGRLGWRPDDFWSATVAELRVALEGRFGARGVAPLAGNELARLRKGLPDGG